MARTDDRNKPTAQHKLTSEEEAALKKFYEHSKAKHGKGFVTLLKSGRIAEQIQKERMREQRETPLQWSEIERGIEGKIKAREKRDDQEWERAALDFARDLTKPPAKRTSAELWDALERFVQLSDAQLAAFKAHYPAFLPARFYDAEPHPETGLSAWQTWRNLLRDAWHSGFHPEYVAQLVNIPTGLPGDTHFEPQPVCDAQRALMAMALESWRARFCPKCGLPFVARRAADKYWPKECFSEQRREKQRASQRKRRRKRAKSSRRTKR